MADSDFIATIEANGTVYSAWESVMVRCDFANQPVRLFEFTPAEGSYGRQFQNFGLVPGDQVTISLAGEQVINGEVTTRSVAYDKASHQIVIAGKCKTADLAKSSVVVKPGTYDGYTFEQAARAVMQPHPSQLIMSNPPQSASKPFANLAVQYGETVGEFVDRIAKMRGLFLWDDENGNLLAGGADPSGAPVADLVEGQNILSATLNWTNDQVLNTFRTTGQQPGNDTNWPPRAISATGQNPGAKPNLFHLHLAEHPGDSEDMASRVNYELALRGQVGVQPSVTVVGWKKPGGGLWQITDQVSLYSPMLFPAQSGPITFGINTLTFKQDGEGTTTTLGLALPWAQSTAKYVGATSGGSGLPQPPQQATPDEPDWQGGQPQ